MGHRHNTTVYTEAERMNEVVELVRKAAKALRGSGPVNKSSVKARAKLFLNKASRIELERYVNGLSDKECDELGIVAQDTSSARQRKHVKTGTPRGWSNWK